jgi:cleavage and polyadenylation specificity factor subunit 4
MEELTDTSSMPRTDEYEPEYWDVRLCRPYFLESSCTKGKECVLKHCSPYSQATCRFFLTGDCTRGSLCYFLHELNCDRLPECRTQRLEGVCMLADCKFRHEVREAKECLYYKMGFCESGKVCPFRHVQRELCPEFMEKGVCRQVDCPLFHLEMLEESALEAAFYDRELPPEHEYSAAYTLCFRCRKFGHKPKQCPNPARDRDRRYARCYSCSEFGHKSNDCPRRH